MHAMDLSLDPVQTAVHTEGTQGPRPSGMKVLVLPLALSKLVHQLT